MSPFKINILKTSFSQAYQPFSFLTGSHMHVVHVKIKDRGTQT